MNQTITLEEGTLAGSTVKKIEKSYYIKCLCCGREYEDNGTILTCRNEHPPSFLRTIYSVKKLTVKSESDGIYKFSDWMPVNRKLNGSSAPVTFKSSILAQKLGLENLFITFSGYWPEKNAKMTTGTFKECEAFTVCARLPEDFKDVLVLASTGNTARAFARVCADNNIKLLLVVPEYLTQMLWFKKELPPNVKLIAVGGNGDYYDAMKIADSIAGMDGFIAEGGAKNVARRDGMGTTVLSAVNTAGEIPDFYFQAIGSGAGAIAAWEENLRLNVSGQYEKKKLKLIVSQNYPFIPMVQSWKQNSRELIKLDEQVAKKQISEISAKVLANRNPTYSIIGGIYDALTESNGTALSITNEEARKAASAFEEEGIDILPPAAVSTASLIKYCRQGLIDKKDIVMLNITGGGIGRFKRDNHLSYLEPSLVIDKTDILAEDTKESILKLFS
jgi:cysteate synthase